MKPQQILYLIFMGFLITACSQPESDDQVDSLEQTPEAVIRAQTPTLSEQYAAMRSKQVRNVEYTLSVDLLSENEFSGRVSARFELADASSPLTMDFSDGSVSEVTLNGKPVPYDYNDWFISIDSSLLSPGDTELEIAYSHPYSTDGSGLYRFLDPEDDRTYLYTDFEPFDANRLFPAFDQPDLKATYELDVFAPCDWQVISSVMESSIEKLEESCHWVFPESARFSTYIFSLHAGEYASWESSAGDIPLRLYVRESLKDYVVPEDWFGFTVHGFDFFQDYFDIDYPYVKYDQVIVPDFNAGAMENVAAVTFSERYLKRGDYTQNDKDRINSVVLHEMAHMWFGNLVTMRWWNGLWLNESFASYMSYLAEAADPNNDRAWMRFYLGYKLWAYETDQQVTTHPIELPVEDSNSAFANFDGITYGKGASVLKQLSFLLDEENFRAGISTYLKEKSNENSELDDFITALAASSNRDLDAWSQQWLYKEGLNSVQAAYECDGEELSSFELLQTSPAESPTIREHRLKIALFSNHQVTHVEELDLTMARQAVDSLIGMPCPSFVYPNYGDWAYIKVGLPEKEFELLATDIHYFEDNHLRAMLWVNLWEATLDAQLPLSKYAGILLDNIAAETNPDILLRLHRTVDGIYGYYYLFNEQDAGKRESFGLNYERIAWEQVIQSTIGGDVQKAWLDSFIRSAHSDEALKKLADLLSGEITLEGLTLDQDRRWSLVKQLVALNYGGAAQIAEEELERDSSDKGQKAFLAAQIAAPDLSQKASFLAKVQDLQSSLTLADKSQGMQNLFQSTQPEVGPALLDAVLAPIADLDTNGQQVFKRNYSRYLIRGYCEEESAQKLDSTLAANPDLSLGITKALRIALQEDQRCLSIKALDSHS